MGTLDRERGRRHDQKKVDWGESKRKAKYGREGSNVANSNTVVLIGLEGVDVPALDYGACGGESCALSNIYEDEFRSQKCALRLLEMGIGLGLAAKMAAPPTVDNWNLYPASLEAWEIRLIEADGIAIFLSAAGKSTYFDRAAARTKSEPPRPMDTSPARIRHSVDRLLE